MIRMCPNCGKENKTTNIKCEFCGQNFIEKEIIDSTNSLNVSVLTSTNGSNKNSLKKAGCVSNIILFMSFGPFILAGILFTGVGLYSYISERSQTKNYDNTIATLKDYINCEYDDGDELCEAVYEYQVNGITYTISPNQLSNPGGFKTTDTVYYNPNNPKEAIIYANWGTLTIIGIIITIVIISFFIKANINLSKMNKKVDK